MATVQQLYELWAGDSELRDELRQSLAPRGSEWLFDSFAALGPRPGQLVVDVGARDARHAIRLVREHGVRAVALDPLPQHVERARAAVAAEGLEEAIEVVEGAIESLPLPDGSAAFVWCRDVLVHADVPRGLAECARILKPGGRMVAYVTLATERLAPRERDELVNALALVSASLDGDELRHAAESAGLALVSEERLGSEWRERMIESGEWDAAADLLSLARLRRRETELAERHGAAAVDAAAGGLLWGVYQLLGKLCPTVFVWRRDA